MLCEAWIITYVRLLARSKSSHLTLIQIFLIDNFLIEKNYVSDNIISDYHPYL